MIDIPLDLEAMIEMANAASEELEGKDFDAVLALINGADLVVGIFQDPKADDGVGWHVIKGQRLLLTSVTEQQNRRVRTACIHCRDLEEAIAMQQLAGEPDALT